MKPDPRSLHYLAAQRLLDQAQQEDLEFAQLLTAMAQVHATLATTSEQVYSDAMRRAEAVQAQ